MTVINSFTPNLSVSIRVVEGKHRSHGVYYCPLLNLTIALMTMFFTVPIGGQCLGNDMPHAKRQSRIESRVLFPRCSAAAA